MGLHDWSRAPDNVFHTFHYGWLYHLAGRLNRDVLPSGWVARPEEYVGPYQSDVLTLETPRGGPGGEGARTTGSGPLPVLTLAPPQLALRKQRRIAVYSARDERRVAVVELVSPGNKDAEAKATHFQSKVVELLESGIHVAIVDVLPATTACPDSFPAAIARVLGAREEPALGERQAASFEVSLAPLQLSLYSRSLELARPLPDDVPLFLEAGEQVPLPLEASYRAAWEWLPAADRSLLEGS